jgi:hypothetical protein
MAKDDILDPGRARFYLWGGVSAADDADDADNQKPVADADSAAVPRDALQLGDFATLVRRVWAMSDPGLQARATIGLAEHAETLAIQLAAVPPYEAVQLLRLIVRHRLFFDTDFFSKLPVALMWLSFEAR